MLIWGIFKDISRKTPSSVKNEAIKTFIVARVQFNDIDALERTAHLNYTIFGMLVKWVPMISITKHNLWWFQVNTKQIHIYTAIQLVCFALLIVVKLTPIAPSFPFFIICLIPLRKSLTKFFEENELEEVCTLFIFVSKRSKLFTQGLVYIYIFYTFLTNSLTPYKIPVES